MADFQLDDADDLDDPSHTVSTACDHVHAIFCVSPKAQLTAQSHAGIAVRSDVNVTTTELVT